MYNTFLNIELSKEFDINTTDENISWSKKADLVAVVNRYITNKQLVEILKVNEDYAFTWDNQESYKKFITENIFVEMFFLLKNSGVFISWME
jgi:hypothetical protein